MDWSFSAIAGYTNRRQVVGGRQLTQLVCFLWAFLPTHIFLQNTEFQLECGAGSVVEVLLAPLESWQRRLVWT